MLTCELCMCTEGGCRVRVTPRVLNGSAEDPRALFHDIARTHSGSTHDC